MLTLNLFLTKNIEISMHPIPPLAIFPTSQTNQRDDNESSTNFACATPYTSPQISPTETSKHASETSITFGHRLAQRIKEIKTKRCPEISESSPEAKRAAKMTAIQNVIFSYPTL